jgi:hypothetical protein
LAASGLKGRAVVSKPLLHPINKRDREIVMGQKVQNLQSRKLERVLFTDESLKFTAEIGLRFSEPFHSSLHSTFRHSYLCSNLLL